MVKFPEAEARKFRNIFVCKKCKSKFRANPLKVKEGSIKCKKCNYKNLRSIKKK